MNEQGLFVGEKVSLRAFEPGDLPALRACLNHPALEGRRSLPGSFSGEAPLSEKQVQDLLTRWQWAEKSLALAVIENASGELVGHAGMGWGWDPHRPDVSLVIDPARWLAGLGSDALRVMLRYLFGCSVAHNVSCWVDDWNKPGLTFASHHGFTDVGRIRRSGIRGGRFHDTVCLDILRPEWRAREGR